MFLEDSDVGRVFASDQSGQVNVSRACTDGAARYDRAQTALTRVRGVLRRTKTTARRRRASLKRTIARRRRIATHDRRTARTACGPGVPL